MRNPKWHRDEIILALDLYFDEHRGPIDDKNKKIIALSHTLNQLPLFQDRPDKERFRNANGVTLKLSNFLALDPDYHGKGMTSLSRLDRAVFEEFYQQRQLLRRIATEIRQISGDPELRQQLQSVEEDEQTISDTVSEGQILYKYHKVIERNPIIILKKKKQALERSGKLSCEACEFDFITFYGDLGKDFIECHHRVPLASFQKSKNTSLDDLALVCANCHRMLHKSIDTMSVEKLRNLIHAKIKGSDAKL
ncbi:HNH endonuclease [Terrimonas sp. NA20]|uniref:HNH endonuclease n=1 Tax=Terrimonas ginsenosidimutans TaxID=2908004 RepID=A0ABS9KKB8_9BACT|nr:HNH endonuclease [Terrimonas ginsenosidimutans]MCG2612767.1 HNH endonuclease [Terrimonas ginsenosidimutans]